MSGEERSRAESSELRRRSGVFLLVLICAHAAAAQQRPRPALSERDARRAIAATPGVELQAGAIRVLGISPRGQTPTRITAEVTLAVRLWRVGEEGAPQAVGGFERRRWRAAEFRVGDRAWEDFDLLAAAAGTESVEPARRALEDLVAELESHKGSGGDGREGPSGMKGPLARGALRINSLSALGSSAVAEIAVEAEFVLDRDARGRWRVGELSIGGISSGDLDVVRRTLDARKAESARAELEMVAAAHERYRLARGLYVAADDFSALIDHLNPLFLGRVVRVDPWHRPYRYAGAPGGYVLSSAGPDGRPDTADDVRVGGRQ